MTGLVMRRPRWPIRSAALAACGIATAAIATGCGGSDTGTANLSELPPTNSLSTEQPTPSAATTTRSRSATASRTDSGGGPTILESIRAASNADNSQYHSGATGPDAPMQKTTQYHFATPSLDASCSTINADTPTLICVGGDTEAQSPASGTGCPIGAGRIVVLTTSGAQQGGCADAAKVLTRSQILPYGNSLSFGDFICAAEASGLFCLDTTVNNGFEMSRGTYRSIQGSQEMPDADVPESTGGN